MADNYASSRGQSYTRINHVLCRYWLTWIPYNTQVSGRQTAALYVHYSRYSTAHRATDKPDEANNQRQNTASRNVVAEVSMYSKHHITATM